MGKEPFVTTLSSFNPSAWLSKGWLSVLKEAAAAAKSASQIDWLRLIQSQLLSLCKQHWVGARTVGIITLSDGLKRAEGFFFEGWRSSACACVSDAQCWRVQNAEFSRVDKNSSIGCRRLSKQLFLPVLREVGGCGDSIALSGVFEPDSDSHLRCSCGTLGLFILCFFYAVFFLFPFLFVSWINHLNETRLLGCPPLPPLYL